MESSGDKTSPLRWHDLVEEGDNASIQVVEDGKQKQSREMELEQTTALEEEWEILEIGSNMDILV